MPCQSNRRLESSIPPIYAGAMPSAEDGYRFAARVSGLKSSAIREILRVVNRPDVISFAGGLPAPELFPHGAFGLDGVLVTQGSQQGLDLVAKLFIDPGDEVLVETPAYVGALQALTFLGARITFLPCDGEGIVPDVLAAALRRRPKLLYITPTFQNPSGLCYSAHRRAEIREVLAGSDTLLLEADPYRELWYDAPPPAPVAEGMDPARFLYMGSFSKTAVPGLRVGFALGPSALVRRCVLAKQAADLHTNSLGQYLLSRLLAEPGFDEHVAGLRRAYGARRDALDAAMSARLGGELSWSR